MMMCGSFFFFLKRAPRLFVCFFQFLSIDVPYCFSRWFFISCRLPCKDEKLKHLIATLPCVGNLVVICTQGVSLSTVEYDTILFLKILITVNFTTWWCESIITKLVIIFDLPFLYISLLSNSNAY